MIIFKLHGGLGNQMFIYAAAKALTLKRKKNLYFDTKTGFEEDVKYRRTYQLSLFPLKVEEASDFLSFRFFWGILMRKISRRLGFCIPNIFFRFYSEKEPYTYHRELSSFLEKCSCYVEGYFQSPLYFDSIREELLADFSFKKEYVNVVSVESELIKMKGSSSVAIGIRRYSEMNGEYGSIRLTSMDYYSQAINRMKKEIDNPTFFIFCEDFEWAREQFAMEENAIFMSPKKGELAALQDMYLFSLCSHHIISNSTFYWWGAWLSQSTDKKVISSNYFSNNSILPSNWIVL